MPGTERDLSGYETILEVEAANFKNEGVLYTDANGLIMMKRKIDKTNKWLDPEKRIGFNITENYYPTSSAVSIYDNASSR